MMYSVYTLIYMMFYVYTGIVINMMQAVLYDVE